MIIKAEKPKLDGSDLEDVIDLSINIGNSASPSTLSITFAGDKADSVADSLTSTSYVQVGGIRFYGSEYSTSVSDGPGGLTSTLEMIDQSFNILDRYYVELNIANHGNGTITSSGDYIFLGQEYYSYSIRTYVWNTTKKVWEVDNNVAVNNQTTVRSSYVSLYNSYKEIYIKYQRALANIEVLDGGGSGGVSSLCTDSTTEPADQLLLPGGPFANSAQIILNFPALTNPTVTKGEIFYQANQVPRNPFGGTALFNATGSLRSVISAIAGQLGKSWYWDCTQSYISSGGVVAAPDASSVEPYEAKGHSYTKGMTRANSFSEGLVYKRYIEGEKSDYNSNFWVWSNSASGGSLTSVFAHAIDAFNVSAPSLSIGNRALLYMELGPELYKALWIRFEGSSPSGKLNDLEQKVIAAKVFAGNSQLGAILDGYEGEYRGGTTFAGTSDYDLVYYDPTEWNNHETSIREAITYMTIWRACGPDGNSSDTNGASRFPIMEWSTGLDPSVLFLCQLNGQGGCVSGTEAYYPLTLEVVQASNRCLIKGSASIFYDQDLIKNCTHGQVFSLLESDSACSNYDLLDQKLDEYIGADYAVIADNSTWSYQFPSCPKEILQAWGQDAIIDVQDSVGPMELGLDADQYNSFQNLGVAAVKKLPQFGSFDTSNESPVIGDYRDFITADSVAIRGYAKVAGDGFANDAKYSQSFSSRLCSTGKGKSNWAIQTVETGAEVNTSTIDQIKAFGSAQCVDQTPFINYTLHGEWDSIDDIGDLDSISVAYGSGGIVTNYSRSFRKSISPSALLFASGRQGGGISAGINLGPTLGRLSPRLKNTIFGK
jgi:hypothetical protein